MLHALCIAGNSFDLFFSLLLLLVMIPGWHASIFFPVSFFFVLLCEGRLLIVQQFISCILKSITCIIFFFLALYYFWDSEGTEKRNLEADGENERRNSISCLPSPVSKRRKANLEAIHGLV